MIVINIYCLLSIIVIYIWLVLLLFDLIFPLSFCHAFNPIAHPISTIPIILTQYPLNPQPKYLILILTIKIQIITNLIFS